MAASAPSPSRTKTARGRPAAKPAAPVASRAAGKGRASAKAVASRSIVRPTGSVARTVSGKGTTASARLKLKPKPEQKANLVPAPRGGNASRGARPAAAPAAHPHADPLWSVVDQYLVAQLVPQDAALTDALRDSTSAGLPTINVAPNQGKFLHLLARIHRARRILEIGTLGGYSAIWLARALPADGRLITLEIDPKHAEVARANLHRAGLADVAEVRLGRAVESLANLVAEAAAPFDLVFIDADKPSHPDYFSWALKLTRPGSVIIVDNVVRRGLVADAASTDLNVIGVRRLNDLIAAEKRVSATSVQTVGSKGHDGFTLIVVGES